MNNDNDSSISSGSCSCNDYNFGPYKYDNSLLKITHVRFSIINNYKIVVKKKSKAKVIENKKSKNKKSEKNISKNNESQEISFVPNTITHNQTYNNIGLNQKSAYKNKNRYFIIDEDISEQNQLKKSKIDRSNSERGIKLKNIKKIDEPKQHIESKEREVKTIIVKKGEKIMPILKEVRIFDPVKKIIENNGQKILVNENTTLTTITTNEIITDMIDKFPDSVLVKQYISRFYNTEISKINYH